MPFDIVQTPENADCRSKIIEDLLYLLLEAYLETKKSSKTIKK